MNTTHPDAKPRSERERDENIWQWFPIGKRFAICTANEEILIRGITMKAAKTLCREHNSIVAHLEIGN